MVGPAAFVAAWVVAGAVAGPGYSPVHDPISRLAAVGADTRVLMTVGFVAFGVAVPVYGGAVRRTVPGPAWVAATVAGLATLGVAVTPLDRAATVDAWHGIAAGTGYVALAATPLLAARPLWRRGHRRLAAAGVVAGSISATCLLLTATELPTGLFQRIGLTSTDLWLAASGLAIASGRVGLDAPVTRRGRPGRRTWSWRAGSRGDG